MLDSIPGIMLPDLPWREITFDQVLLYYDGPRLLLRRTDDGQLYLAWWSDADESVDRWLYLPVTTSRLRDVLTGKTPSRNALNSPEEGYVLAVDVSSETDDIIQAVKTNASALPQDSIPLPGSRIGVSEETWNVVEARITEAVALAPPYEYHGDTGEISIPKREIIHLHRAMLSVASVITEQLADLEANGVSVVIGDNGPPADALNDYVLTIPAFNEIGRLMQALPERNIGKVEIPVDVALALLRGTRAASLIVTKLSQEMTTHQLTAEGTDFAASELDNWEVAVRISAALDGFMKPRLDVPNAMQATLASAGHKVFQRLLQETDSITPPA